MIGGRIGHMGGVIMMYHFVYQKIQRLTSQHNKPIKLKQRLQVVQQVVQQVDQQVVQQVDQQVDQQVVQLSSQTIKQRMLRL